MVYKLKRLNVVKRVSTEAKKAELLAQGFREVKESKKPGAKKGEPDTFGGKEDKGAGTKDEG